jgi:uncharacterized membrane protein YcaP (DUF421 family)
MQPFDLILLVMIGDLVQQGITQNDFSVTGLVLAAGTIAVLAIATSYSGFKLPWLRPVLEGDPVLVLQDGEPIRKNLDRNRITIDELHAAARLQGIARLADVQWAVLETGGQISFIQRLDA